MLDKVKESKQARHYTFPISTEMLTPENVVRVGDAVWSFLWCVDRTTSEVMRNGECRGRVLGGYVVPTGRISAELGLPEKIVREQLEKLADLQLLTLIPRDDGYIIEVRRSVKWQNRKAATVTAPGPERSGEGPVPMKSLVEGLRERLAAREAAETHRGGAQQ